MSLPAYNQLNELDKGINLYFEDIFKEVISKEEEHKYYKTALITCHLLKNRESLAYPSVKSNGKGMNIVFTKEFIDKYAYFNRAFVHEVVEIKSEFDIRIRSIYAAETTNQFRDFIWKRVKDSDVHTIDENMYDH